VVSYFKKCSKGLNSLIILVAWEPGSKGTLVLLWELARCSDPFIQRGCGGQFVVSGWWYGPSGAPHKVALP